VIQDAKREYDVESPGISEHLAIEIQDDSLPAHAPHLFDMFWSTVARGDIESKQCKCLAQPSETRADFQHLHALVTGEIDMGE